VGIAGKAPAAPRAAALREYSAFSSTGRDHQLLKLRRVYAAMFGLVGVVFLAGGPVASIASDWGVQVTLTLGGAGVVALAIAVVMLRNADA
jgi:hypothetical protein